MDFVVGLRAEAENEKRLTEHREALSALRRQVDSLKNATLKAPEHPAADPVQVVAPSSVTAPPHDPGSSMQAGIKKITVGKRLPPEKPLLLTGCVTGIMLLLILIPLLIMRYWQQRSRSRRRL